MLSRKIMVYAFENVNENITQCTFFDEIFLFCSEEMSLRTKNCHMMFYTVFVVKIILISSKNVLIDILMDSLLPNFLNFFGRIVVVCKWLCSWSSFVFFILLLTLSFERMFVPRISLWSSASLYFFWDCSFTGDSLPSLKEVTKYTSLFPSGCIGRTLCVTRCPSLSRIVRNDWICKNINFR